MRAVTQADIRVGMRHLEADTLRTALELPLGSMFAEDFVSGSGRFDGAAAHRHDAVAVVNRGI